MNAITTTQTHRIGKDPYPALSMIVGSIPVLAISVAKVLSVTEQVLSVWDTFTATSRFMLSSEKSELFGNKRWCNGAMLMVQRYHIG